MLQQDPAHMDARFYRGTALERLGKLDEAIHDFSAVLQKDANHIKASYARAACRNKKGEFDAAIRAPHAR